MYIPKLTCALFVNAKPAKTFCKSGSDCRITMHGHLCGHLCGGQSQTIVIFENHARLFTTPNTKDQLIHTIFMNFKVYLVKGSTKLIIFHGRRAGLKARWKIPAKYFFPK